MKEEANEKYILFSPIGGTDPISNCRDGSMLHIARKYKPEKIIMFLSSEMLEHHNYDNRYYETLDKLQQSEGFKTEVLIEQRPELKDVQKFETFFHEFRPLVEKFHYDNEEYTLLLNVSSGTPAMKLTLFMLAAFLPFKTKMIQTSTPEKRQNPRSDPDTEYDVDLYWETNLDNDESSFNDRCEEVSNVNLITEVEKDNIRTLIEKYDYNAAFKLAAQMKELINPEVIKLLEAAKMRSELNAKSIPSKEIKVKFGVNGDNQNRRLDIAEFLLWLNMKYEREDFGDYLRAISPAIFALMKIAVEEKGNFPIGEKCCKKNNRFIDKKIETEEIGQEFLQILRKYCKNKGLYLISGHYDVVIEEKFSDRIWARPLQLLRAVEESVRNDLAHSITPINKEWIEKRLTDPDNRPNEKLRENGINTIEKVNKLFKKAVGILNKDILKKNSTKLEVNWNAYNDMNKLIKDTLGLPITEPQNS